MSSYEETDALRKSFQQEAQNLLTWAKVQKSMSLLDEASAKTVFMIVGLASSESLLLEHNFLLPILDAQIDECTSLPLKEKFVDVANIAKKLGSELYP